MADIRFKDLTTTASSTASDDFFAVDGTTNGTRKLNAFSPTFGGNATVTGTLTTNGGVIIPAAGSISTLTSTNATHVANATWGAISQGYGTTADWSVFNKSQGTVMYVPTGTSNLFLYGKLDANTLSVYSTTASTSTSTGALVVGNGTSGGLGVGGNVTVGGQVDINAGTAAAPSLKLNGTNNGLFYNGSNIVRIAANGTLAASIGVAGSEFSGVLTAGSGTHTFGTSANSASVLVQRITTNPSAVSLNALVSFANIDFTSEGGGYTFGAIKSNGSEILRIFNGNLAAITPVAGGGLAVGGGLNVSATTASTSTSSGALVVSGGVGVAGAINCGSGLVANPLFTQTRKLEAQIPHTVSTEDYLRIGSNTGSTNTYAGEFGYGLTAGGSPQIRFNRVHAGTVTTWLTVPTSTGDAEFAGSVKTAAPSGGTAAAWKLGTVASVSPTSPNRTIEVDIGGTIYYIHAKTTNN